MSPSGLRGLQSRCEARRTSRVCSIRIRLRHLIHLHLRQLIRMRLCHLIHLCLRYEIRICLTH